MSPRGLCTAALATLIGVMTTCGPAVATRPAVEQPTALPMPTPSLLLSGTGAVARMLLTYDDLMLGGAIASPIDDRALALPAEAAHPLHTFEGRLELRGEEMGGSFRRLAGASDPLPEAQHLPEFDYAFVQAGSYLIPVRRGLIITDHPTWNLIVEPGRVWREDGDHGYSRASFPFALAWKDANGIFNGVMGFLFDDFGISKVWYQITQETAVGIQADFWGLLDAAYHREPVPDGDQVRQAYERELADRFPSRPIAQLAADYPGIDLSAFGGGVAPEHLTGYGFVVGGVDYLGPCRTRYEEYPYCGQMRMPSYSTAKSIFASGVLMRLAQKYDPGVASQLIRDYVPEAAGAAGDWSRVTFDHTLDMATGNYRSAAYMDDEENPRESAFWEAGSYADRTAAAFGWPNSAEPGRQWVYHTSDTFIVVRAMQNYLHTQEGAETDIFEFFVDEVLVPLRVGPGAHSTLRTSDDNWQGQPLGGFGLWLTHDDIAKIVTLLNRDRGAADGTQLLHPGLLDAALQRTPRDRGVDVARNVKYNNGFWATRFGQAEGFDCEFWVPHMLGYSGVVIALLPNDTAYYYFSDSREFTWTDAVREADKIIPLCP